MKNIITNLIFLIGFILSAQAQTEINFNKLDSVYAYADKNSSVTKTNYQQTLLAKYQKIAALANVVNLRNPVTFSLTDNTTLPVSFIPLSVITGGKQSGFEKITLGQQYVSNFNITPQIDLINPGAWAQIKTANINEELTATNNLLNKKSLHESIAACYFNIISFNEQVDITTKNLSATDTLLQIVSNKFAQGLVRQQDVNDATVNKLSLQDKLNQLKISLEQQYNSLKILCEMPQSTKINIKDAMSYNQSFTPEMEATSQLQAKANMLQMEYAKADLRTNRLYNLPVISLLYSNSYYQNSVTKFFDNNPNNPWLNSAYFGAKITLNLPDVNHILSSRNAKINYQTALINMNHSKLQTDIANNQLRLDYEKAYSQFMANQQIAKLKEDNYRMALNQYNQAILSFNNLLIYFNDMLISRFNASSSLANLMYTKSKIDINNNIK
ncbi:MAG TPA: TolC family protein [Bacteroidia bacterium]|nr:TolC family protein [Bacteroidia bacterium]